MNRDFTKARQEKWFIRGTSASPLIERNELCLSESAANWPLEEYIVKPDKTYRIIVANGLSRRALSSSELELRKTPYIPE
mgnify:CR=1 FL=1